jgi:hypothetical protein
MPSPSWLHILGRGALMIPAVREALTTTLNGLERDPVLLKFVGSMQKVDQKDCLICLAYGIGNMTPPEHWCPTRENAELCGCGKKATRQGVAPGVDRKVCDEFPGCIPVNRKRT